MTKKQNRHKKKAQYKIKLDIVKGYANKLKNNLPKSEVWFNDELKKRNINIPNLLSNEVFGLYIPDYICHDLKVIIEVDGSIHELTSVKENDIKKDEYYKNNGYTVIRVKAYSTNSFMECLSKVLSIIENKNKPILNKTHTFKTDRVNSLCYVCQCYKGKHTVNNDNTLYKLCGYCIKLNDPFKLVK